MADDEIDFVVPLVLGRPLSLRILVVLEDGRRTATDLARQLAVASEEVSHELEALVDAELVERVGGRPDVYEARVQGWGALRATLADLARRSARRV